MSINELYNNISPHSIIRYTTCFAVGTGVLATAGWMGGQIFHWIVPGVAPAAHAVAAGLWAPASLALYGLALLINRNGGPVNHTFGIIGGYFAAITVTNMLGYSVSYAAPFLGLASLSFPIAAGLALAAPIALALIAISSLGKTLRNFILRVE
jgi:hypothetical protein